MSDDPDDAALAAALTIELLLDACRDGTFYADHDESQAMLADAYEALDTLTHAATTVEDTYYTTTSGPNLARGGIVLNTPVDTSEWLRIFYDRLKKPS